MKNPALTTLLALGIFGFGCSESESDGDAPPADESAADASIAEATPSSSPSEPDSTPAADASTPAPSALDAAAATSSDAAVSQVPPTDAGVATQDAATPAIEPVNTCPFDDTVTLSSQPIDVVFVVDNGSSIAPQVDALEANINSNFAEPLDAAGIDYRVIMFSGYRAGENQTGQGNRVCVDAPLGPEPCDGRDATVSPHNEPKFYHFDQPTIAVRSACLLLDTLSSPPYQWSESWNLSAPNRADDPIAQEGWGALLRPEALKVFVLMARLSNDCSWEGFSLRAGAFADTFDELLRREAPELFGRTGVDRKFTWHSIAGVEEAAEPTAVYEPADPIVEDSCGNVPGYSYGFQVLSRRTGGIRFPVCSYDSFDSPLSRIKDGMIESAGAPCRFQLPAGYDPDAAEAELQLAYAPPNGSASPSLSQVPDEDSCGTTLGWYFDDPLAPTEIRSCPATCYRLTQDGATGADLRFTCGGD